MKDLSFRMYVWAASVRKISAFIGSAVQSSVYVTIKVVDFVSFGMMDLYFPWRLYRLINGYISCLRFDFMNLSLTIPELLIVINCANNKILLNKY